MKLQGCLRYLRLNNIKADRIEVFISFGASPEQAEELFNYSRSGLTDQFTPDLSHDEPFIEAWDIYYEESKRNGVFNSLRKYIPKLKFPVREGISETIEYKNVTLKGEVYNSDFILLADPDAVTLDIYQSEAGKIPVIFTENRDDFIALVQALAHKNEPHTIPASMGACMVKGFNNHDRIERYRTEWELKNKDKSWAEYFNEFQTRKELYQDRFILLSNNGYSGVDAAALGISGDKWKELSFIIRREHECTHYLTQRVFGTARNNMFDELIADYAGIVKATGRFDAKWFLKFIGLENFPLYRQGGRMENYRGNSPLSDGAFAVLQKLTHQCALNLEKKEKHFTDVNAIINLYKMSLEELAGM